MVLGAGSKFSVELANPAGQVFADLTGRAPQRSISWSRNEAEDIAWNLDLNDFENLASRLNVAPQSLLIPYQTEVRIKRGSTYLAGGQLAYYKPKLTASGATIELKATGFLNMFKDRYTAAESIYTAEDASAIAWAEIDTSQSETNGDFGVTQGDLATVGNHDRTYRRTNLKDLIQAFGNLQNGSFDHKFSYDKVFSTYARLGSDKEGLLFEYPGNIIELEVPNDATSLANRITVLGSGFGEEAQVQTVVNDTDSQAQYKIREKIIQSSNVQEEQTLEDQGQAEAAARSTTNEIPILTLDGNVSPFVISDYEVGDRIPVKISNHELLSHINGMYRIEKIDFQVDEEDNETVKLYVVA